MEYEMKDGVSCFKYWIIEDIVELDVRVVFDEYGEGEIDEILVDGLDVTAEIVSFGLADKLMNCDACIEKFERNVEEYNADF